MVGTPSRRHFKSLFANYSVSPGLSAALKISGIFRYYDAFHRQFTCTLKEDEALYDALQMEMNEVYSNEIECNAALRVKRTGVYAARVNGSWKRVRVDRIDYDANQCSIETVDDGQLLTVNRFELFMLDPKLLTNQYKRTFGVLVAKQNSLVAAGFIDGQKLRNGQLVNIFVFSDREPFLALLTEAIVKIQVEKAATLSGESYRCRGVAFGSYSTANLPCDTWCDVTVVAFESLEDMQVRGPEQSIRLMYLEQFLESVYGNEELRSKLAFETGVHVNEGLACVAWDANNQRWVRARVTCTSGDRSVLDVICVDYPSITLRSLKFRDGEIYMLRTDLLFPPLCCSIRAIDATDKLDIFTKSTVAKEVLQVGTHVRVYSPASSTLSVIELVNGLKLEEYIEHAVEVDSVRQSQLGQNYSDMLENIDTANQLYFTSGKDSRADIAPFSSSMNFPRTVLVPQEYHFEPFSHSLSVGSHRRILPLRCGNFENDYLNKSLTSYESDSEHETFSKSVRQKQQSKRPSVVVVRPSPPLYNSDSYSENSDPREALRFKLKSVQVEVLSINCATEIFLSTAETKMRYEALRKKLSYIDDIDLLPVLGSWCSQNEHYLFWFDDCWNRVKILAREDDDWKVLCVDTGEEKFVKYNSRFYRLPKRLSIEEWPPTCLGPLRLSGPMDARWLGIGARIFLRSICEKALHLTALFGKGESDRSIVLYDEKGRCLNEHFVKFIEKQTLIK
uniref:Tudor domain-containing protein n=1 Tax=Elaeophora elaphi TaxID=1147741 RepID=A0A0R3S075_9BILA